MTGVRFNPWIRRLRPDLEKAGGSILPKTGTGTLHRLITLMGVMWGAAVIPTSHAIAAEAASLSTATAAQAQPLASLPVEIVNVRDFGAAGDGIANDTDEIYAAIRHAITHHARQVYFPAGTYLCGMPADGRLFLFPVGNSANLEFVGEAGQSTLKLADAMPRGAVLFGSGRGQSIAKLSWRNLAVDLNGAENLQSAFSDPLRLNSFIYCFSPNISDILVENIHIRDGSGSQMIRFSDDSSSVPNRITIRNCVFENFGLGVPGNFQRDVSCVYVFGNDVTISDCRFVNRAFTFNIGRGHTAIEYHAGRGLQISRCSFSEVQLPILIASDLGDVSEARITECDFDNTAYAFTLDKAGGANVNNIRFEHNRYRSEKPVGVGIIYVGHTEEQAKTRRGIAVSDNTFEVKTSTQGRVGIILQNSYWNDIQISRNVFKNLTAEAIFLAGATRIADEQEIVIAHNRFDSCGSTTAGSPYWPHDGTPVQLALSPSSPARFKAIIIEHNIFENSAGKNYQKAGQIYLGANLRTARLSLEGNEAPSSATLLRDARVSPPPAPAPEK